MAQRGMFPQVFFQQEEVRTVGRFDQRFLNSVSLVVGAFALAVVLAMCSEVQAQEGLPDHDPGNPFAQLSLKLDAVRDAITALPAGTALSDKLDEVLLAITPIPAGPSLSEKLDEVLVEITALPAGTDLSVKLDEVLLAITPTPAGPSLSEKLDEVLVAIDATPSGGAPPCGAGTEGVRFVVSTDGTEVCDNTTGLVWEQTPDSIKREWQAAIAFCPTIGYRLPEVKELFSLVDFSQSNPTLPAGHPFSNVQSSIY